MPTYISQTLAGNIGPEKRKMEWLCGWSNPLDWVMAPLRRKKQAFDERSYLLGMQRIDSMIATLQGMLPRLQSQSATLKASAKKAYKPPVNRMKQDNSQYLDFMKQAAGWDAHIRMVNINIGTLNSHKLHLEKMYMTRQIQESQRDVIRQMRGVTEKDLETFDREMDKMDDVMKSTEEFEQRMMQMNTRSTEEIIIDEDELLKEAEEEYNAATTAAVLDQFVGSSPPPVTIKDSIIPFNAGVPTTDNKVPATHL
jgi:hypothetical protein